MDYKHNLKSTLNFNNLEYQLELFLNENSDIVSIVFKIDELKIDCPNLIGQNLTQLNLQDLSFEHEDFLFYILILKISRTKVSLPSDIHCRCLGLTSDDINLSIRKCLTFKNVIEDCQVATRCTLCLEDTMLKWSMLTGTDPKMKFKSINGQSEIELLISLSKKLTGFSIYKLSFPLLFLKPRKTLNKSYQEELEQIHDWLKSEFKLDFLVRFIF